MIWVFGTIMALAVAAALALPFLRRRNVAAVGAAPYDRQVYRTQLSEVDRDLARGVIGEDDAARLRIEIGRKLLDADRQAQAQAPAVSAPWRGMAAAAVAVVAVAGGLYAVLGSPMMADAPIALRKAEADAVYAARPSQAEAEAAAPPRMPAAPPDPAYVTLVDQLRAAVEQRPDDPRGLALLAEHEGRLGNVAAALEAQRRLMALVGDKASPDDHTRLAALMIEAAGGVMTREAEAEVAKAIALDPANAQARYMQGLLMAQNQRPDRAFAIWRGLLEQDPAAPWASTIREVIGDLAWFAGEPDYVPPAAPATATEAPAPGPDAAAVAAAGDMTDAERADMIGQMVTRLEERLATQGGTPEEWARLIGALAVQGDTAHAAEILTEARATFAGQPEALAALDAAAAQAGLE